MEHWRGFLWRKYSRKNNAHPIFKVREAGAGRCCVRFYENENLGLGKSFKAENKKAALRIAEYPIGWSINPGPICQLGRTDPLYFPVLELPA